MPFFIFSARAEENQAIPFNIRGALRLMGGPTRIFLDQP
jgi:hypothetical protein